MITQELLNYVAQRKSAGVTEGDIRSSLINNGWDAKDVDAVLGGAINDPSSPPTAVPSPISRSDAAAKIKEMGKFKASKLLFVQSLNLLKKDKEVILFPMLSGAVSLIIFVIFSIAIWFSGLVQPQGEDLVATNEVVFYVVLFVYYVISYFILTYFRVGLTAVVYERINGGDIDFKEGMNRAKRIAGKIFTWSLLAGTVGIVLKIISDRSKWLGKLVASLLGAAWGIVTFFIAPTLLLDDVSVWQSVKNSGSVFKKTWGETLITNISLSLISFLAILSTFIFYGILLRLVMSAGGGLFGLIALGALFIITLFMISIISTSLSEIFKVALYSYARFGVVAEGFSPEFIVGAVKQEEVKK